MGEQWKIRTRFGFGMTSPVYLQKLEIPLDCRRYFNLLRGDDMSKLSFDDYERQLAGVPEAHLTSGICRCWQKLKLMQKRTMGLV